MNTVQFECCSLCEGKPLVEPTLASIDINILEKPTYWPYLLKNPRGARWGLLPTLRWVESWLPTYLTNFFFSFFSFFFSLRQIERRFHSGNPIANHSIQNWVRLHYHLVI